MTSNNTSWAAEAFIVALTTRPPSALSQANCTPILAYFKHDVLTIYTGLKVFFALIYGLIFLLGVLGNSAIIYITFVNRQLRTVQNLLILNMDVADLLSCLISLPVTPIFLIYKEWYFGQALCHLIPWLQASSMLISSLSLIAIAVDRYILIVKPHQRPLRPNTAYVLIVLIWATSGLVAGPYAFFMKHKQYNGICGHFCDEAWPDETTTKQVFSAIIMVLQLIMPVTIMAVCYGNVLVTLQRHVHQKLARTSSNAGELGKVQMLQRKQRTTIVLVLMVGFFIICWVPHMVMTMVHDYMGEALERPIKNYIYMIYMITHSLSSLSLLSNPILYVWLNSQFRDNVARMLAFHKAGFARRRNANQSGGAVSGRATTNGGGRLCGGEDTVAQDGPYDEGEEDEEGPEKIGMTTIVTQNGGTHLAYARRLSDDESGEKYYQRAPICPTQAIGGTSRRKSSQDARLISTTPVAQKKKSNTKRPSLSSNGYGYPAALISGNEEDGGGAMQRDHSTYDNLTPPPTPKSDHGGSGDAEDRRQSTGSESIEPAASDGLLIDNQPDIICSLGNRTDDDKSAILASHKEQSSKLKDASIAQKPSPKSTIWPALKSGRTNLSYISASPKLSSRPANDYVIESAMIALQKPRGNSLINQMPPASFYPASREGIAKLSLKKCLTIDVVETNSS